MCLPPSPSAELWCSGRACSLGSSSPLGTTGTHTQGQIVIEVLSRTPPTRASAPSFGPHHRSHPSHASRLDAWALALSYPCPNGNVMFDYSLQDEENSHRLAQQLAPTRLASWMFNWASVHHSQTVGLARTKARPTQGHTLSL